MFFAKLKMLKVAHKICSKNLFEKTLATTTISFLNEHHSPEKQSKEKCDNKLRTVCGSKCNLGGIQIKVLTLPFDLF